MPRVSGRASRTPPAEARVWDLLTKPVSWPFPSDHPVKVHVGDQVIEEGAKFQAFEVLVAAIFARLRPEYEWRVTPSGPDGGLDFIGRHAWLRDDLLRIAAQITIGGQCKKRGPDADFADVSWSLSRMAETVDPPPTLFVIAFSARITTKRVEAARRLLERTHGRDCHILDRQQLEGLIQDHLPVVDDILRGRLTDEETEAVVSYFRGLDTGRRVTSVSVVGPARVLAGVPFAVTVALRASIVAAPAARVWWQRRDAGGGVNESAIFISPVGADSATGASLASDATDDPLHVERTLEFVSYAVGTIDLGEVVVGFDYEGAREPVARVDLGSVDVVDNMRPPFFERPFLASRARLRDAYERAVVTGLATVGVVGAGGSGKTRLCEDFEFERRRRGSVVVAAKQAKTFDDPHRLLAELFIGLASRYVEPAAPAASVVRALAQYDSEVAKRAEPAIRSIFGRPDPSHRAVSEDSILSALVLLTAARARRSALIVHLQDLHWCAADVLGLLDRLVWQLGVAVGTSTAPRQRPETGVLFIFEGRVRERQGSTDGWDSEPFELFLEKLDCPVARCAPFEPLNGREFVRRLFEDHHLASRAGDEQLLELQRELVDRINRSAGGNPFHSLEQVRLLRERRIVERNPTTGLFYIVQPETEGSLLPDSVFAAIELRWRYLKARAPELALLVWAAALLEDRVPAPLFRRLRSELAPDVSLADIEATDLLWTGDGETHEVAFRHENYFRSIRRFEVAPRDRERVVEIYSDWFAALPRREPSDQFRWARALLELPTPPFARARKLMLSALRGARRAGDVSLARRIAAASLDLAWREDDHSPLPIASFVRRCDEDLALTRELVGSDRQHAARRLDQLLGRLERRLATGGARSAQSRAKLEYRRLEGEVVRAQILFNDRQPGVASEIAARAGRGTRALLEGGASGEAGSWQALEVEALHTQAVAVALAGDVEQALKVSRRATELAAESDSPLARHVLSTYANILLAKDPAEAESILRRLLDELVAADDGERAATEINLSMALVLRAHSRGDDEESGARRLLDEAEQRLTPVYDRAFQLGDWADAAAAALMLGVASAVRGDPGEVSWFAQAVAAAARGRQMETLWRAHVNLATATHRRGGYADARARDHARAGLEIMEDTLSPYAEPDHSARFELLRVPLAHAVRFLIESGDDVGVAALERYPELRSAFEDPAGGVLRADRGGYSSHEWLRVGDYDYVIY